MNNIDSAIAFGLGALATSLVYNDDFSISVIDAVLAFGVYLTVALVFDLVKKLFA